MNFSYLKKQSFFELSDYNYCTKLTFKQKNGCYSLIVEFLVLEMSCCSLTFAF